MSNPCNASALIGGKVVFCHYPKGHAVRCSFDRAQDPPDSAPAKLREIDQLLMQWMHSGIPNREVLEAIQAVVRR